MIKQVPDKTGRFSQRPHYEPKDLDRECEQIISKFLKERHGKAEYPVTTDDLTLLIEQRTEDLDLFADLSSYGPDVEGLTEFRLRQRPRVKIAAPLADDAKRENRLRTTLTHEFGHVHFHAYLWDMEPPQPDLLKRKPEANKQICKRDNLIGAAQTDWMEWQAGYVCGALLMPVSRVRELVRRYQEPKGLFGPIKVEGIHGQELIEEVRGAFQVSAHAAKVRLLKLGLADLKGSGPSLFSV